MNPTERRLDECQHIIGYYFSNPLLLETALTHSSLRAPDRECNERLEFLGDSVLGLVITEELYHLLPDQSEGELTRIKSAVVSRSALLSTSQRLGLQQFAEFARGVGKRDKLPASVVANLVEAIIGAIYLDAGYYPAREFVLRHMGGAIDDELNDRGAKNYKSLLQHEVQQSVGVTPTYRTIDADGPDHAKEFVVAAIIRGQEWGQANGPTKKDAEQDAARLALEAWERRGRGRRRRRKRKGDDAPEGVENEALDVAGSDDEVVADFADADADEPAPVEPEPTSEAAAEPEGEAEAPRRRRKKRARRRRASARDVVDEPAIEVESAAGEPAPLPEPTAAPEGDAAEPEPETAPAAEASERAPRRSRRRARRGPRKVEAAAEPQAEPEPEPAPEPEPTPQAAVEPDPEPKPRVRRGRASRAKPKSAPEPKTELKTERKPPPKPAPKVEPKPEREPAPQAVAKPRVERKSKARPSTPSAFAAGIGAPASAKPSKPRVAKTAKVKAPARKPAPARPKKRAAEEGGFGAGI